jgi:tetratricopeptide (TPR) repeat protein
VTLHLESEPPAEADVSERFAVVLLGFRNDLARLRVRSWVNEHVERPPAELSLPFTVFGQVDLETGTRLSAELGQLGALVRLTRLGDDREPAPLAVPAVAESSPLPVRHPSNRRVVRLLIIGAIAVICALRLRRVDQGNDELVGGAAHPQTRVTSAIPEQRREASAQIKRLIAQGDLASALHAIDRVLEVEEDPTALALKGEVSVKRSDWNAARTAYERAVQVGSHDPQVFLALANIYREQGMQRAAVDMLHRAKENGASGGEFESLVRLIVTEQDAESDFGAVTSPHFTLSFDEGEDYAAAQLIQSHLEDAYLTVGHKLGVYPSHRTPVVLYAARDFQRVTHSPGWAGALYDGRIKVPVRGLRADMPEIARTIRHEYAHALIMSIAGGRCPVWLNEGVAMWAEEEVDGEREQWALAAMQLHRPFRLADLEKSFGRLSDLQAAAAYGQSYLAVRHILGRYGELPLQKLLTAFATTASTDEAFRQALGIELSSFEDELHFEQGGAG